MNIYLATANEGKIREIQHFLGNEPVKDLALNSLADLPETVRNLWQPVEDGATFLENARIKAKSLQIITGQAVLAEDSGLEVDALGGEPGIYSARYGNSDQERMQKLLQALAGVPRQERSARFVTSLCFADSAGNCIFFQGKVEGLITEEISGSGGFGYDPVFFYPPAGITFAQMSRSQKQQVSHRGQALQAFFRYFRNFYA